MCQDGCIDVGHGICVQDPFEHSVNLLSKASLAYSGNFIAWCRTVSNFSQTKVGLLSKVLLNTSPKCFTLEKPSRFSEDQWKTTIEKVTVDILHKILCYEVSVKRTPSEIAFTCAGTHDLWQNRSTALKTLLPKLSPNATDMEKEIAVTALILSQNPSVVKDYKRPARITVTFDKKLKAHFTRLRMNNYKKHFDHFLYLKIIKYLDEADKQSAVFASPDTTQDIDVKPDVMSPELANIVPKGESTHSEENNTEYVIIKEENSSINTEIKAENVSEDEVEDVPADFFQDFNRDSFLEGLDLGWVSDEDNAATGKRKRAFCSSDDSRDSTNSCRPKKMRRSGEDVPLTLESVQEQKDKILSQCEQVLRFMTYQRPKRLQPQFASQGHMSPLFRTNIRFNCTSASRTQFSDCLLSILRSVGIIGESNDVSDVIDLVTEDVASGAVMNKTLIARLLQISLLISKPSEKKVVDGAEQSTSDGNGDC
ncbi:uncharacterized protein LOC135140964 [Zophobas morio]|uniref:uncharacterized protein LOC135140964 n=1 Tax=Zophobas morio TaxID=2755281 RepID=UPI003083ED79